MKVALVTLFPEMFAAITDYGVTGRAVSNGLLEVKAFNPRQFTDDKHQTVDDRPYGGGPGMVMLIEPLRQAIAAARQWQGQSSQGKDSKVIYLSPQGRVLNQQGVNTLVKESNLILVAGRYEGIDERLIQQEVDEEWSIGDYVLSGGELPAMVLMDAIIRHLPGALGHQDSAVEDSFAEGLLDCPHYTRPVVDEDYQAAVPDVLLSGNHEKIRQWRLRQSLKRTLTRRPELLKDLQLTDEQQAILAEIEAQQAD
ncbi:tRNA (guanosine(37)-N1)-methyltransferase TrmD [Porticoccus sp. W117]|uniref:tRNA (guanosine(37)-N1)-methyltransferase TrmD n=1 Tax=Porticoccus sp. W117 TaxID=3054777 RepID=UPI00259796C0|nr:tRNA (guanosine(37)-N1)-methyltransferase TrmD [Porticoccus sp. W117]MDM3872640.1 tRNA (guanosine(37)-N1)-methyltransferase TrmD [Porticoccus sp. W117]